MDILTLLQEVEAAGNTVLETIEALDPNLPIPQNLIKELEALINASVSAWVKASGKTTFTADDFAALLPKPEPLTDPTA